MALYLLTICLMNVFNNVIMMILDLTNKVTVTYYNYVNFATYKTQFFWSLYICVLCGKRCVDFQKNSYPEPGVSLSLSHDIKW